MITVNDILETNRMITENKLDVRTITLGLSLRDCAHPNLKQFCDNVYDKITKSGDGAMPSFHVLYSRFFSCRRKYVLCVPNLTNIV